VIGVYGDKIADFRTLEEIKRLPVNAPNPSAVTDAIAPARTSRHDIDE
jgi:hypothetical protein